MQGLHIKRAAVRKVDLHPVGSIGLTDLDIMDLPETAF